MYAVHAAPRMRIVQPGPIMPRLAAEFSVASDVVIEPYLSALDTPMALVVTAGLRLRYTHQEKTTHQNTTDNGATRNSFYELN
jgi:hypothetical protein